MGDYGADGDGDGDADDAADSGDLLFDASRPWMPCRDKLSMRWHLGPEQKNAWPTSPFKRRG